MPEPPYCDLPGHAVCDKTRCTCGELCTAGESDAVGARLPGCETSFILKPFDPLQSLPHCTSKHSTMSSCSSRTVHRLKLELQVCTEQCQPVSRVGVSMTELIRWNIGKVVEKNPCIDLDNAIQNCLHRLDVEACTGQYCLPKTRSKPESAEDRHISCAILAWQAKGERNLDKLVQLAESIRKSTNVKIGISKCSTRLQESTEPPPPPNQLCRDYPKNEFSKKVTEAFLCETEGCVTKSPVSSNRGSRKSSPGRRKPSPERKGSKFRSKVELAGTEQRKNFYEGLAGPVIRLPDACRCQFKPFPPVPTTTDQNEYSVFTEYTASAPQPEEEEEQGKEQLDIPVCLEGKCMERLKALDKALAALRQRAARLSKRDQERKQMLERAEKAWQDMERGLQKQLVLTTEKEDDTAERMAKLLEERNGFKSKCLCGDDELQNSAQLGQAADMRLGQLVPALENKEKEKLELEKQWQRLDADLHKERALTNNKQRELMCTEERLRTRSQAMTDDLAAQKRLTSEVDRALRTELEHLKEQFNVISKQLLQVDDQNTAMKQKLSQMKEKKLEMFSALESCRDKCDKNFASVKSDLVTKNKILKKKREEVIACSCKIPVDTSCQARRSPSFVAACRCTTAEPEKSCPCTSLKNRMMMDLIKHIFEGMKEEVTEGTAMPCELLKCMEEDFDWNVGTPLKQKLQNFFKLLLQNELDMAIATAIEQYHGRVNDSCLDHRRTKKKESKPKVTVMRLEKAASLRLPSISLPPMPVPLDVEAVSFPEAGDSPPGGRSPSPAASEGPWKRTQADVYQLSLQLRDLKRESIKRRDLKSMETNLASIVKHVIKTQRTTKRELSKSQLPHAFESTSLKTAPQPLQKHTSGIREGRREHGSAKVTKDLGGELKCNEPVAKLNPVKESPKIKPETLSHLYVPSLNSADLCHSPKNSSPLLKESEIRTKLLNKQNLLNSTVLGTEAASTTVVKEHRTKNVVPMPKKKSNITPRYKNEYYYYKSDYQGPMRINAPESLTKPTFTQQFALEGLLKIHESISSYKDEQTIEVSARRETYNRLISECLQSYTRGTMLVETNNILEGKRAVHEKENHFELESVLRLSNHNYDTNNYSDNETGSLASWKTAQDEDNKSILESAWISNISNNMEKELNQYEFQYPTKMSAQIKCEDHESKNNPINTFKNICEVTKKIQIMSSHDLECDNTIFDTNFYANDDKSLVGVYFMNNLCKSVTSLFNCNKSSKKAKPGCSCDDEDIGAHIRKVRGDKNKVEKKSGQKPKIQFKDTKNNKCKDTKNKGGSKKSATSLKSKTSLASSTKSKYHRQCVLDSSLRESLEKKKKNKPRIKSGKPICSPCGKFTKVTTTSSSHEKYDKEVQSKSKTCSDICSIECQCDLNSEKKLLNTKIDASTSKQIDTEVKGVKLCLCDFKSLGAMLIRDKNAARVYGGDRLGVGPFRGIFGPDQQPLGEAAKFAFVCEEAASARADVIGQSDNTAAAGTRESSGDATNLNPSGGRGSSSAPGDGSRISSAGQSEGTIKGSKTQSTRPVDEKTQGKNIISITGSKSSGDAKTADCTDRSQSSSKRESFVCSRTLSQGGKSVGVGSHKCECLYSVASAQVQTSEVNYCAERNDRDQNQRDSLKGDDDSSDDGEECVCCSKQTDAEKTKDLEVNAFQLLQKYILAKIKKMKCDCCPFLNPDIDENSMYLSLFEKIQEVISEDIGRLACRCRDKNDIDNNEYMAFSLLEEYIKSKLEEIICSCNGTRSDVNPEFYAELLKSIKDVIDNDLAEIQCCCHSVMNECPCNKAVSLKKSESDLLNQASVSDKICETLFNDRGTQTLGEESASSKCVQGIKSIIKKLSQGNLYIGAKTTDNQKTPNGNKEEESVWCKCLLARYGSSISYGAESGTSNLKTSKQNLTSSESKHNGINKRFPNFESKTSSDKCSNICPCNKKDVRESNGSRLSQDRCENGGGSLSALNSQQDISNLKSQSYNSPAHGVKRSSPDRNSSRRSSPDLTGCSQKSFVTFNPEASARLQSGVANESSHVINDTCGICKLQRIRFCPVCKSDITGSITFQDGKSEVRDVLRPSKDRGSSQVRAPSQGIVTCSCDPNIKSCVCSNATNTFQIPPEFQRSISYQGPVMQEVEKTYPRQTMYQGQYPSNMSYEPTNMKTIYPGPVNASASRVSGTNNSQSAAIYMGATIECTCDVNMEPCKCNGGNGGIDALGGVGGASGRNGVDGRCSVGGRAARSSRINFKTPGKCCSSCKNKSESTKKSSKRSNISCHCIEKF